MGGARAGERLRAYVEAHNLGVRTGDFTSTLALFDEGAVFELSNGRAGPFRGVAAIAEAFRARPPDDELVLDDVGTGGASATAAYRWRSGRGTPGTLEVAVTTTGRIARLVVR